MLREWIIFIVSCFLLLILSPISHAQELKLREEPEYCNLVHFSRHEIYSFRKNKKLVRARGFKLGDVVFVGLSVGRSDVDELIQLAEAYDQGEDIQIKKYCTWYLHAPTLNPIYLANSLLAKSRFNYTPIDKNPRDLVSSEAVSEVMQAVKSSFIEQAPSFVSCLVKNKYLAVGCQGMMHRGPTVFGAILAFSGCSPQNSAAIVNRVWGLNGVAPEVRLAVIEAAHVYGLVHPTESQAISNLLSQK